MTNFKHWTTADLFNSMDKLLETGYDDNPVVFNRTYEKRIVEIKNELMRRRDKK